MNCHANIKVLVLLKCISVTIFFDVYHVWNIIVALKLCFEFATNKRKTKLSFIDSILACPWQNVSLIMNIGVDFLLRTFLLSPI